MGFISGIRFYISKEIAPNLYKSRSTNKYPARAIFLLNGFHELVKNGMSGCADGLGLRR